MTTSHQTIAQAVKNVLAADPPIADGNVHVGRPRAVSSDKQSAVIIRLERARSTAAAVMGGRTSWDTLISIECYGRDGAAAVAGATADFIVEAVFQRLADNPTLDGLAMDVEPFPDSLEWDYDQLEASMASITARFIVKHQTTGRTLIS